MCLCFVRALSLRHHRALWASEARVDVTAGAVDFTAVGLGCLDVDVAIIFPSGRIMKMMFEAWILTAIAQESHAR